MQNARALSNLRLPVARTYQNALRIIESRRRGGRPKGDGKEPKMNPYRRAPLRGSPNIEGMSSWLQMLGHSTKDLNGLNVVHIAGTKGKGSTCAFTESFLRAHGRRTGFPAKIGLYTSPHLMVPEERIRINFEPLNQDLFAKYFFEIYDRIPQLAEPYDISKPTVERGPRLIQLFTLFALHVFIRESVNVTILETHSGGEYDSTNIIEQPIVAAITKLGMDHVETLGPTIENIAWHKSGIYKRGVYSLSTTQDPIPDLILKQRAKEKGQDLHIVREDPRLAHIEPPLEPPVQRENASLALAATETLLQRLAPCGNQLLTQEDIDSGVKQWSWLGRFQRILDGELTWFLDAAHDEMSVKIASSWFAKSRKDAEVLSTSNCIVIFSHISAIRDANGLLKSFVSGLREQALSISHVIFSTYDEIDQALTEKKYEIPNSFHQIWKECFPKTKIWNEPTIKEAIDRAESLANQQQDGRAHILVTGSQHLVGPALRILTQQGAAI